MVIFEVYTNISYHNYFKMIIVCSLLFIKSLAMELKLKIGYNEIWELVKQLPKSQILQLKTDIETAIIEQEKTETTDFQKLLLQGPVMSDEQYAEYLENRK